VLVIANNRKLTKQLEEEILEEAEKESIKKHMIELMKEGLSVSINRNFYGDQEVKITFFGEFISSDIIAGNL
jgi:uncharacterized protein (DUF2344 family)